MPEYIPVEDWNDIIIRKGAIALYDIDTYQMISGAAGTVEVSQISLCSLRLCGEKDYGAVALRFDNHDYLEAARHCTLQVMDVARGPWHMKR